jgi:hypothetical protein
LAESPGSALACTASLFEADGESHLLSRGEAAMTYDTWKATNPADEWLGPEPPYDADDDFEKSLNVAYAAVQMLLFLIDFTYPLSSTRKAKDCSP